MVLSVPAQLGYPALAGLVAGESAGLPIPGETALLVAGALAGAGHLALPLVVAVAVVAAAVGDTLGYWAGRRGGRAVLLRRGPLLDARARALDRGERFFAAHGPKAVFLGRFVPGVRVVAAMMAGASAMPWPRFALFNVSGAVVWATVVAGLAALLGPAVSPAFGLVAVAAAVLAGAGVAVRAARARRRSRRHPAPAAPAVPTGAAR